jgi:hypothetical protein
MRQDCETAITIGSASLINVVGEGRQHSLPIFSAAKAGTSADDLYAGVLLYVVGT